MAALKKYSRALDLLLASVIAYKKGDVEQAGRFFTRAADTEGFDETLDTLDEMNEQASRQAPKMAAAIASAAKKKALAKKRVAKADAEGEDDDLGMEEIDLETSDGEDVAPEGGEDIDTMLDNLDTEQSAGDGDGDECDDAEGDDADTEEGEAMQVPGDGQTGGDTESGPLQEGLPKDAPDAESEGREAKASAAKKAVAARTARTARNMRVLSRLVRPAKAKK